MADETKADPGDVIDLTDEAQLAELKAENEELRAQLEAEKRADEDRGPLWRRIVAGILAVLAIVAVVAAVEALWLKTTLENEDQFVATFEPLPQNDAVASALSVRLANGVVETTEVQVFITDLLPSGLSFLALPITESVTEVIATASNEVIQSDQVTTVWSTALRGTHIAVSAVLSGNDRALVAENGAVAIDLNEVAAVIVERVEALGFELPDTDVDLGAVVIYESDQLAAAQDVAQAISTIGWFLPLIALVLIALAVVASTNRRKMVAILGFGTAVALLLSLVTLRVTRNALLGDIEPQISRNAAEAIWDITLARLIGATWALLLLALIVGFVAWLVGPSARAEGMRARGASAMDGWRRPLEDEPGAFTLFLVEWKRTIQVVIVVLGLLFVLFGPTPTGWLVIGTALVVLGLVVLVEVLAGPTPVEEPELEDAEV